MLRLSLVLVGVLGAACGGVVVLEEDDDGAGGSSAGPGSSSASSSKSASASTTNASASSSSGGATCASLEAAFQQAVAAAQSCNPFLSIPQCSLIVDDRCGCPTIVLNETAPDLVQAVQQAYAAWVNAGCGPLDCGFCDPAEGGGCSQNPDGQTGTCVGFTTF